MERADFNPNNAPVYELVAEVLRLRADIAHIAAAVVQQAVEREWCDDYDRWARVTNRLLSRPVLILRDDWYDEPQVGPYRDPATGEPESAYDPSLDESGRFSVVPPAISGCMCPVCQQARRERG